MEMTLAQVFELHTKLQMLRDAQHILGQIDQEDDEIAEYVREAYYTIREAIISTQKRVDSFKG